MLVKNLNTITLFTNLITILKIFSLFFKNTSVISLMITLALDNFSKKLKIGIYSKLIKTFAKIV